MAANPLSSALLSVRGPNALRALPALPLLRNPSSLRFASSSKKPEPIKPANILEKPDKFRPPSHGSRLPRGGAAGRTTRFEPVNYPGPKESQETIDARKTKKYPNMFPAEGTLMYKFLTSKGIHLWIAFSVLFTLASFTWKTEFARNSPYAHLLPTWGALLVHPVDTVAQFIQVMKMHSEHVTIQTAERRKKNAEDVERRRLYRVAHGLEAPQEGDKEKLAALRRQVSAENGAAEPGTEAAEAAEQAVVFEEQAKKKPVKKWLGIW
ncbi:protein transport protein S31 [Ascosphaera pollenicola]|nr:protein transport protein S31 [Ascosphaera pollenicola]